VVRLGFELAHLELRVERVADVEDGPQEARGLFDEAQERFLHQEREKPRTRRGLDQHLISMRQQVRVAVAATVLAVVVDRVVVARSRLEGQELRLCHGPRGYVERLAQDEVLKVARRAKAVAGRIEMLTAVLIHDGVR